MPLAKAPPRTAAETVLAAIIGKLAQSKDRAVREWARKLKSKDRCGSVRRAK